MNTKQLSVLSYVTPIGWGVAYYLFTQGDKNLLVQYHLKQSLGLILLGFLFGIAVRLLAFISMDVAQIVSWVGVPLIIFLIFGIINAFNGVERPVPLIGDLFKDKFNFIR